MLKNFLDFVDGIALLLIIASPVILIWGIIRYMASGAIEVASGVTGSDRGVAFGEKHLKKGKLLSIIGIVGILLAVVIFWLSGMFYPMN